jgi:hypothetical protein
MQWLEAALRLRPRCGLALCIRQSLIGSNKYLHNDADLSDRIDVYQIVVLLLLLAAVQLYRCIYRVHSMGGGPNLVVRRRPDTPRTKVIKIQMSGICGGRRLNRFNYDEMFSFLLPASSRKTYH